MELLDKAITSTSDTEKVAYLNQTQEYVVHQNILDNFLDEILGFQNDKFAEVRKFVAGFIEVACLKEPDYFPKVILNLNMMLADEVPNVLKKTIQVLTQLYKVFLKWIAFVPLTEEIESTWDVWGQIKNYIFSLIDSTENDGVRTQCVKFLETSILCQTKKDVFTTDSNFSLDDIAESQSKLVDPEVLEDEAKELFEQLVSFQAKIHISSVNLMATLQSLSFIARQRSKMFFTKVVVAFDALVINLPPTLAKSQVNSVNKQLKLLYFTFLKHPYAYSAKLNTQICQTLSSLGASQSELNRCLQEVKKRGIKIDSSNEKKKVKVEPEVEDSDVENGKGESKFNLENCLYELSKHFPKQDAHFAVEETAKDMTQRLNNINIVSELVISSLHLFPEKMSDCLIHSKSKLSQVDEIAKQLALQLTLSGIGLYRECCAQFLMFVYSLGPGVSKIKEKYEKHIESTYKVKVDSEISRRVLSLVKKCLHKELKKMDSHHKIKLNQSGKTGMSSVAKIKKLDLLEITKPLDTNEKMKLIEDSVTRIMGNRLNYFSSKELKVYYKILGKFISEFSFLSNLKTSIKDYIFSDIRNRHEILFTTLYAEYVRSKKESIHVSSYASYLYWIIDSIMNSCDNKDKNQFLYKFYVEAPYLTDDVIGLLKKYITMNPDQLDECFLSGVSLAELLIQKRLKHRFAVLNAVLSVLVQTGNFECHSFLLETIKGFYTTNTALVPAIEAFALSHLKLLLDNECPKSISGTKDDLQWNDENIKCCMSLFLELIPLNHKLIHQLPSIYVKSNSNMKRAILRLIQTPVVMMGMSSVEILNLVETCPVGAETLISRVVHILADKQTPTSKLVSHVRTLYHKRNLDVRFLIPVINGLNKKEIISLLPQLIKLNPIVIKETFNRLLAPHGKYELYCMVCTNVRFSGLVSCKCAQSDICIRFDDCIAQR